MSDEALSQHPNEIDLSVDADKYKIGPGKPPIANRWKKGGSSPNPSGRPRKPKSILPDFKKALNEALNQKVALSRNGKQIVFTRIALGFEQLTIQFAKGDHQARRDVFLLAEKFGVDLTGALQAAAETILPDHQKILDAYEKRLLTCDIVERKRVLAPDDPLDDDVEKKR